MDTHVRFRETIADPGNALLFGLTFVVAICSIVYELIYSELLTVIFGGTVVRYSITIGLFLFSFGIGSFLFNYVDERQSNFFRIEALLAVVGPSGMVYIMLLNSFPEIALLSEDVTLVLSHLPIVLVGMLSGLEIPFLTTLVESDGSSFSEVLGIDYFGSLFGTVVYALVLYPSVGLIPAIFVLGLLNALAAIAFALRFSKTSRTLFVICLLISGTYIGILMYNDEVEDQLTEIYLSNQFEAEYPNSQMAIDITEHRTTRYQDIVLTTRKWTDSPQQWQGPTGSEQCLRLDSMLQLCDSWVESYHNGLVDVPATFSENISEKEVLIIGGGDWIAINHLTQYNVSIDHVDIDGEFMQYTKDHPFFEQYHDDAYKYNKLNTVIADGYDYLREHEQKYDLILLDIPGIRSDDLMKLYSTEFYTLLSRSLEEKGMLVVWAYSKYTFPAHHKTYMNTVRAAGFNYYFPYYSYDDLDGDGDVEQIERFYILTKNYTPTPRWNSSENVYIERYREQYSDLSWNVIPWYEGVDVNSIFDPNYDIIIDY